MAYTLGNKSTKNICKRTVLVQFIIENVVACLFQRHNVDADPCHFYIIYQVFNMKFHQRITTFNSQSSSTVFTSSGGCVNRSVLSVHTQQ